MVTMGQKLMVMEDPGAYGDYPPAQGIVILGGPYMDADGIDNPDNECDESINGVGFGDGDCRQRKIWHEQICLL